MNFRILQAKVMSVYEYTEIVAGATLMARGRIATLRFPEVDLDFQTHFCNK